MVNQRRRRSEKIGLTICVAIPTFNRERVLVDTVEQVLTQDPPADEVLVIDQTDEHEAETEAYLRGKHDAGRLRWIRQSPPNLPAARNRAVEETACDVIIFIDDDVELPPDFIEKHRKNYSHPNVVAVAGRVIQPGLSVPVKKAWPPIMDHRFFPLDSDVRKENVVNFRGCNHSVRVDALKQISGYDENYIGWAYREDSDAAIRIWKAGGNIVFDPKAELMHLAIPGGGCRIKSEKNRIPEWRVSFPASYFACRHLFPAWEFWKLVLFKDFRKYAFRKDTVFRPWRLPMAVVAYGYALARAAFLARGPVKSPFVDGANQK